MSSPWRISCNQEISAGGYLRPEGLSKCPLNKLLGNYPFADKGCTAHGHHQGQHGARLAPQWCNTPGNLRVALQAQHSRQVGTCCPGAQSVSISPTKASKPVQENVLIVCPGRGQRECHPRAHVAPGVNRVSTGGHRKGTPGRGRSLCRGPECASCPGQQEFAFKTETPFKEQTSSETTKDLPQVTAGDVPGCGTVCTNYVNKFLSSVAGPYAKSLP